jgi:hypothetical protein
MNRKLKKIITNWKVILLAVFLIFALVSIHPNPNVDGLMIRSVAMNSSASIGGIVSPKPTASPMSKERVLTINNEPVNDLDGYNKVIENLQPNKKITVETNKGLYTLETKAITLVKELNETEIISINETQTVNKTINGTTQLVNETITVEKEVPKTETVILGTEDIGLTLATPPTTNIRKGLELQGGTRVLLEPEDKISDDTMSILLANMEQRLNVFGLSDVVIRTAGEFLSEKQFIVVEIAGANEEEVKELLAKQGKFESKIKNETIFVGGTDITYVCRSGDCSGIDPTRGCSRLSDGSYACRFRFSIALSPEAAKRQSDATEKLEIITVDENGNPVPRQEQYLNDQIVLYLDDVEVDRLNIVLQELEL